MGRVHTLAERATTEVGPAEVEAALLENYPALVRLAYLILSSSLGRHRRVLAAHGVVQRAMPDRRRLERQLIGETSASAYIRRKVLHDAVRQAHARTPLRLLPAVWGFRLFPRSGAADDLVLDQVMAGCTPEARAAWALVRIEHLDVTEAESELRAAGIDSAAAAIQEAAELDESAVAGVRGPLDAQVFDPCAVRLAPTDLMRRKARGRAVAIIVTIVLALILLVSLALTAGREQSTAQVDRLTVGAQSVPGSVIALPGQLNSPVSAHLTTGDTIRPLTK